MAEQGSRLGGRAESAALSTCGKDDQISDEQQKAQFLAAKSERLKSHDFSTWGSVFSH